LRRGLHYSYTYSIYRASAYPPPPGPHVVRSRIRSWLRGVESGLLCGQKNISLSAHLSEWQLHDLNNRTDERNRSATVLCARLNLQHTRIHQHLFPKHRSQIYDSLLARIGRSFSTFWCQHHERHVSTQQLYFFDRLSSKVRRKYYFMVFRFVERPNKSRAKIQQIIFAGTKSIYIKLGVRDFFQ
jgi:hypothetical protein